MKLSLLASIFVLMGCSVYAQQPQLVSADLGTISWTNSLTQGVVNIEWTQALGNSWKQDWSSLRSRPITGSVMTAAVPMFFRVAAYPSIEWVIISNAHNAADSTGYGAVNYSFRISKFEVNNDQYASFLNAVDPSGVNTSQLYNISMGTESRGGISKLSLNPDGMKYLVRTNIFMQNKPVIYVSFWDACRFCNWMHNGQGSGNTETGAYDLVGVNPANTSVSRSPGARYFLPNEDEWYKAAYYYSAGANYWLYPTRANTAPTVATAASNGDIVVNSDWLANYNRGAVWNNQDGNLTSVGSGGPSSWSSYHVADMAGNAEEWNESSFSTNSRVIRGGCWFDLEQFLRSTARNGMSPSNELSSVGFRIACPL